MSYPKPSITADIVVFDKGEILFIKRKKDPYKDYLAFPGGFFDPNSDASIQVAAKRELFEETNIDLPLERFMFALYQDQIGRDPRDRVVSFIFTVLGPIDRTKIRAQDDAKEFVWKSVADILDNRFKLAFDHFEILQKLMDTD